MPDQHIDHLLIGGGVASAACAKALREGGATGTIAILGRELDPPYHRPPATKEYLRGEQDKEQAHVHPASWYDEHDVELRTRTNVRAIDTSAKTVKLQGGEEISYGAALLATGSLVNRLRIDGSDLEGLHYVRALANADGIREEAEGAESVVVVGGSYIGCEVAASLSQMGKRVTIVMQEDQPMQTGFGERVGSWVRGVLEGHGVTVLGGQQVDRFEGGEGEDARVERVITASGQVIDADVVVLGTGVKPDVMLAKAAGLEIGESGGVKCDSRLRTSAPDVYAAGDICEYDSTIHGRRIRVEHEAVAEAQGASVAAAMLGSEDDHTAVPYFWTDLADWASAEYVGPAQSWDEEIVRGDPAGGQFSVLYLDGGTLVACLSIGRADDLEAATAIIAAGGALPANTQLRNAT
jgi:3-phenylpropionate/trans-cinnamate dioxygenase ferredoxin reductase subunit